MSRLLLVLFAFLVFTAACFVLLTAGQPAAEAPVPSAGGAHGPADPSAAVPEMGPGGVGDGGATIPRSDRIVGEPGTVCGIVVDGEGEPLPGATVTLAAIVEPDADRSAIERGGMIDTMRAAELARRRGAPGAGAERSTGTSAADGRFLFRPEGEGPFTLTVALAGHGTRHLAGVRPDGRENVFVLLPGATVGGRVVSVEDGEPIGSARISLPGHLSRSDGTGRFRVADVAPGVANLEFHAPAFEATTVTLTLEPGGSVDDVTVRLNPGPGILGTVVDPAGKPVAGARVTARMGLGRSDSALSDAKGRFALGNVVAGAWKLEATDDDHAPAESQTVRYAEGDRLTDVVLRLRTGAVVSGIVLDPGSQPVEGARVGALAAGAASDVIFGTIARASAASNGATTDEHGEFEIKALGPGEYEIEARVDGYPAAKSAAFALPPGGRERVEIRLKSGPVVTGVVTDARGRPIEGAEVQPVGAGMAGYMPQLATGPKATTKADGTFVLAGLDGPGNLRATKSGYAKAEVQNVRPDQRDLSFVLADLGSISGRVLSAETGEPIDAYRIDVASATVPFAGIPGMPKPGEPEVLEAGRFRITGLEPGTYNLSFYSDEHAPGRAAGTTVEAGRETGGVEIRLENGAALTGRVVADATGDPVPGAEVLADISGSAFAGMLGFGEKRTVTTDDAGGFTLPALPEGTTILTITHADYAKSVTQGVQVPGDGALVVRLAAGGTVIARVRDAGGNPVASTTVLMQRQVPFTQLMGQTDTAGEMRFTHVPPGAWMVMKVDVEAMQRGQMGAGGLDFHTVNVKDAVDTVVEIAPKGGATVRGRVTRGEEPVSGAMVFLMKSGQGTASLDGMKFGNTNGEGRYEIQGVEPGRYALAVSKAGDFTPAHSVDLTVSGTGTIDRDLEIPSATVSGRIVGPDGEGVTGATVVAIAEGSAAFRGGDMSEAMNAFGGFQITGDKGRFRFEGIRSGAYVLRASKDGYASVYSDRVVVPEFGAGPSDLVVRLRNAAETTVTVRGPDGAVLPDAWVFVTDTQGRLVTPGMRQGVKTGPNGTASLALAPGDYRVEVQAAGHPAVFRSVAVSDGSGGGVVVDLPAAGSLAATVVDGDDAPVAGARVTLLDADGRPASRRMTDDVIGDPGDPTRTDDAGRIAYPLVAPGRYRLEVSTDDGRRAESTIEVRAGAEARTTLTLK